MTQYFVTYCAMDTETGNSPFWHAALLLSKQESETSPIIVDDAVGYYSQPSSTKNYFVRGLKWLLGLSMDLQNTHGVLLKEQIRYIDGNGLHGVTFEVTVDKFNHLKALYAEKILNVATLSITPERVDYSFMLRASKSLAVRSGIIALMVALVIAATFISTPVGAVLATAATLYGAHQAYNFFREDRQFTKMRADYRAYHGAKRNDAQPDAEATGLQGIR